MCARNLDESADIPKDCQFIAGCQPVPHKFACWEMVDEKTIKAFFLLFQPISTCVIMYADIRTAPTSITWHIFTLSQHSGWKPRPQIQPYQAWMKTCCSR